MKKEGLVFYPFDQSKQAYFFGNEENKKPVIEYDLMTNDSLSKEEYETSVFMAKQAISSGQIKKVVLARNEIISGDYDPISVFKNSVRKYSSSYGYYVNIGPEQWVGASPELLIHYETGMLKTIALAGTKSLNEDFTSKEKNEQQMVCDFIEEKLHSLKLADYQKSATIEEIFNTIKHLKTSYEVPCSPNEALELLKTLQPTSAVCGLPRDNSFEFIQDFETMNRKR
jgi:isochorismate synthase